MKRMFIILAFGIWFGFVDNFMRNKSVELEILIGRGLFASLLVSLGMISAFVRKGEKIKNAILKCNKEIIIFFVAYFIGGMLLKIFPY